MTVTTDRVLNTPPWGIFGGKDLSDDFPQYGNSALYCVTEIHTKEDIDFLANALDEILNQKNRN